MAKHEAKYKAYSIPTTVTVAATGPGFGPYYPHPGTAPPFSPPVTVPTTTPSRPIQVGPGQDYLPVLERIATALEKIVERFC